MSSMQCVPIVKAGFQKGCLFLVWFLGLFSRALTVSAGFFFWRGQNRWMVKDGWKYALSSLRPLAQCHEALMWDISLGRGRKTGYRGKLDETVNRGGMLRMSS